MRIHTKALGMALLALGLAAKPLQAGAGAPASRPGAGVFGISGDLGYYTYGMGDVNNRFRQGGDNPISGGLGFGGALKLGVTPTLAGKLAIDYLFASRESQRTVGGTTYRTRVDMPATMVFIGGELEILAVAPLSLKLIAGGTLLSIYNGNERGDDRSLDFGSINGSGAGFQAGLGLEIFLSKSLSLETDLGYNQARIDGVNFAGSPSAPNSRSDGTVDYSGLMAKLAFTVFINP